MARTHLFAQLKRALKTAAKLEVTRTATQEGLERLAEVRWSRRRFLSATATATAGATLGAGGLARPALGSDGPRTVVVGAGCAGLTCAYRLQQRGVRARVLEAGTRIGGRMFTLRDAFPDGQTAELGGEFIDTGHRSLRRLARELGLTLVDLTAVDDLEGDVYFFDNRVVPFADIVDAFRSVAARILEDLGTIGGDGFVSYKRPNNGGALDNTSLAEWLDTRVGAGVMRSLLEVAYVGEYGLEADQQSALNLLFLIGTGSDTFDVFGDSDERFRIAEGSDSVPGRLARRLEAPIELETRLEAIRRAGNGTYLLTVARGGTVTDVKADRVVLTLPFTLLRQVDLRVELPPAKRLAIDTLGYGTNAKILAGFSRRVWHEVGSAGYTFSDSGYQSSWEASRGQSGSHAIVTNYLGGDRGLASSAGSAEERAGEFVAQFDRVFPGAVAAHTGAAVRYHWPTAPHAQASYACYRPGQYSTIAGAEKERVGGLHFAGEHTSVNFQGYMNGACQSGERVAAEVLEAQLRS